MPKSDKIAVGYVLRKFPVLSETFVLNEILGLEARGVAVQIFSLAPPRDPCFHEGLARLASPVWYVPGTGDFRTLLRNASAARRRYGRRYWRTLARVLASGRPALFWRFLQAAFVAERAGRLRLPRLHAHFATRATTVAGLASSIAGLPYSFTAHAFDIYRSSVRPRLLTGKIDRASFVVTISEANLSYLRGLANGHGEKIVLLRNGIDLRAFAPDGDEKSQPYTILSVARLVEKKGIPVLIEACRHLRDRGVPFRCAIVGRGRMRPELQATIDRWELRDRVRLLGARKQGEVLKRYRSAWVYALPSIVGSDGNREGLPVSIVEALACGLPVVSTPVAGIPEVVRHEHNGLLVPERDAGALADALERLITDRPFYDGLRANTRASVDPEFDLTHTSRALRRLFEEARA